MRKKCMFLVITAVIIITMIIMSGCGGTANTMRSETQTSGGYEDIDELLGLSDKDDASGDDENKDITEEDVLKLLGVVDEGNKEISQPEESESQFNRYNYKDENAGSGSYDTQEKTAGMERDTRSFTTKYNEAFQFYKDHQYLEAIQKFKNLISENSNHKLSDNCQYWIGECYYDMKNYEQAIISFEKVFSFTDSNKDDDAQLKLGICYHRLNQNDKAKEEFQRLITYYPDSEYVSVARSYLNKYN